MLSRSRKSLSGLMMNPLHEPACQRLAEVLKAPQALAIAVSGGVDSMTLAAFAAEQRPDLTLFHAASGAVPSAARQRLEDIALARDWQLEVIDAGEMQDGRYRSNPVNRCYFCKQNLYAAIRLHTGAAIASGTNTDDLGDYRPGLQAAAEAGVFHPFVEAAFDKLMVRRLARALGLDALAVLPASPCLSSRVHTGIPIDGELLALIDQAELLVSAALAEAGDVRCRITAGGLVMQLDALLLAEVDIPAVSAALYALFRGSQHWQLAENIQWAPYLRGSAFDRTQAELRHD